MDFATVAIGLGVCVIAAGVLFLISMFSFKERTFEEALAEQQKLTDSLLKSDKVTKNEKEKKTKKPVKKNKEKEKIHVEAPVPSAPVASDVIQQATVEEKAHVEFEPDPEIIPDEVAAPAPADKEKEKKKSDKKEKGKPILRNRDSHSPIPPETLQVTTDDPANHFLEHPPKDAVEMKNNGAKHGGSKAGSKSAKSGAESPTEIPVVEPIAIKEVAFTVGGKSAAPAATSAAAPAAPTVPASAAQPTGTGTPKKQQRKKASGGKSDSLDAVDGGEELLLMLGGTEKLLSAVQRVPLSAADLQTMIEVLLNRQQEADGAVESEWMESGGRLDPLSLLRRQLAEKEKALKEEQEVSLAYQNKLKTLGAEMASERTRSAAARKQLEENLARQSAEFQALTLKLTQVSEQYAAETAALRSTVQHVQKTAQMSDDQARQLQRLQEEKAQMEARFAGAQTLQQELGSRVQQLEELLHRKEELFRMQEQQRAAQDVEVQNQLQMYAAKLQEAEQTKASLITSQSHEAQSQLHQLREALGLAEAQALHVARETQARFEEMERTKQLLEDRITTVERDLVLERNISAQKENDAGQEVTRLRDEFLHMQSRAAAVERELQTEREAVARKESNSGQEVARYAQENQMLKDRVAVIEQSLQSERESIAQKESLSNQEATRLHQENQALRERITAIEAESASKETEELVRLRNEIQQLQDRLANAVQLQTERESVAQKENESSAECTRLRDENQQLKDRLDVAERSLQTELESEKQKDSEELIHLRETNQALSQQLVSSQEAYQAAQGQLEAVIKEKQGELDSQKQKNNELREKNYKAMDALAAAEKSLIELKKSATSSATSSTQVQQRFTALLQRIFPDLVLSASSNEDVFAKEVVSQVTASMQRLTAEEQTKAHSQVQHYKTVLAQTEELLNRLQNRVEAEEQSWKSGMVRLESDVAAAQQERDFWMEQCQKQELTHQQQLQETKEQSAPVDVSPLQSRIESLEKQVDLERQTAADLTAQLNQKQQLLQTNVESLAQERQAIRSLRQQLEQESAKSDTSDLSSQLEEKQRLLLEAEESLAQEKVTVGLLREQLEQVKAEMAAAKLGSIGFMVGWSKAAHSSAVLGSVAVATAATRKRHSCDNLESLLTSPVTTVPKPAPTLQQGGSLTKMEAPATNGNGTAEPLSPDAEWSISEDSVVAQTSVTNTSSNSKKGRHRKKKGASHFAS